jgi:hypothetical protein
MTATPDVSTTVRSLTEVYAEGQRYFMGKGILNNTLTQLTGDLKEHGIEYMAIGAVGDDRAAQVKRSGRRSGVD